MNRALSKQLSRLKNEDYVAIRAKRIGEPAPFSGHELDTKLPLYHEVKRLDSLGDLKEGEVSYVIFKDQQTVDKTFAKADVPLFKYDITSQFKDLNLPQGYFVYKVEKISRRFELRTKYAEQLHAAKIDLSDIGSIKTLPSGQQYKVVRFIKSGASGDVYEIEIRDGKEVHRLAAKSIKNSEIPEYQMSDIIEAEVANMVRLNRNVNFIEYYGSFKDKNNRVVLLQELGVTDLEDIFVLKTSGLALPDRGGVFKDMADGVAVLHVRAMMHGDIKPQNMVLGLDGKVKIIDTADLHIIESGKRPTMTGSPDYMAPEMWAGKSVAAEIDWRKTDIFSLGMSFFEMKVGKRVGEVTEELGIPSSMFGLRKSVESGELLGKLRKSKYNDDSPEMALIFEMIDPAWAKRLSIDVVQARLHVIFPQRH